MSACLCFCMICVVADGEAVAEMQYCCWEKKQKPKCVTTKARRALSAALQPAISKALPACPADRSAASAAHDIGAPSPFQSRRMLAHLICMPLLPSTPSISTLPTTAACFSSAKSNARLPAVWTLRLRQRLARPAPLRSLSSTRSLPPAHPRRLGRRCSLVLSSCNPTPALGFAGSTTSAAPSARHGGPL